MNSKGPASHIPLKTRFEKFAKSLRGYENIDELLKSRQVGLPRADYLVWDRQFIIEQKSLDNDRHKQVEAFVQDLLKTRGIIVYGQIGIEQVLRKQPDQEELRKRIYEIASKSVGALMEKADDQVRGARDLFQIPDAKGILVVLNETASAIDPSLIAFKFNEMMRKKRNGILRYNSNCAAILISESHSINSGSMVVHPCVFVPAPGYEGDYEIRAFFHELVHRWAEYNGVPALQGSIHLDRFRQTVPKPLHSQPPR